MNSGTRVGEAEAGVHCLSHSSGIENGIEVDDDEDGGYAGEIAFKPRPSSNLTRDSDWHQVCILRQCRVWHHET